MQNSILKTSICLAMSFLISACGPSSDVKTELSAEELDVYQRKLNITLNDPARRLKLIAKAVSYTHLRAHETRGNLVCRLLLEKKK